MLELSVSPHPAAALPPHPWPGVALFHGRHRHDPVDDDDVEEARATQVHWTEEDCVQLHWVLLSEINRLADPDTPLDVVFDTLRWIFTERSKDPLPFSFANCLQVVGCSPMSPIAFCGRVDAEAIRDHIRSRMTPWWKALLARYPAWVRDAVLSHPEWVESQLRQNPQWLNERLKASTAQADFFL